MDASCVDNAATGPRAWVVIVTHNGTRWIRSCLESIPDENVGIVVIDNGSTDETIEAVRCGRSSAIIVAKTENIGFGAASNLGIRRALDAGAEYVCLLNQDLTVEPRAIECLVEHMDRNVEYGLLSAFQLNYDGTRIDPVFRQYLPSEYWDDVVLRQPRDAYATGFVGAAAIILRREALLEAGGFDPLFFMYAEDNDLCIRFQNAGWMVGIVPSARVRHWHGLCASVRSFRWQANLEYSRALLHLKHSPRALPIAFATLFRNWGRAWSVKQRMARIMAFLKCVGRCRAIARHRRANPCPFDAEAGGSQPNVSAVERGSLCVRAVES